MTSHAADALRTRLHLDPDADVSSLTTDTDNTISIGRDVWRLRWRNELTTAVAGDADLSTTCGALLDALALLEMEHERAARHGVDPTLSLETVNVLVDRELSTEVNSETDQALRSLRDATQGVTARLWYRQEDSSWLEDRAPAPVWRPDDPRITGWVDELLLPRLTTQPGAFVLDLVDAINDPSLHLYPSAIKVGSNETWALRIDGLQIGITSAHTAKLAIGKPGDAGDGPQRTAFIETFGQANVTVSDSRHGSHGHLSIVEAAERVRALLRRFREADVPGAPISHRQRRGVRVIDEHTLESRLLKGLITVGANTDIGRICDDDDVARGSQFPTLWGHGAKARYLDAMLRRGTTPLAIELKVATGGHGRYYRRSLVQAVLYRHFIRNAPALEPWFHTARLDRTATESLVGIPIPTRWTPAFEHRLQRLQRIAARVGVGVNILDDRATPDFVAHAGLPEPAEDALEQLSWRLASALSHKWPKTLGCVLEVHGADGSYDQIQLQSIHDRRLHTPSPTPRVSLNRPGSLWVFAQTGNPRWTWREIWNHLAHGGDPAAAADIVGAIAGLGPPEAGTGAVFAEMAAAFLNAVPTKAWSWRCAWPHDDDTSHWIDRYARPLSRYNRVPVDDKLPTIARIWGAVRDGEAAAIVDQENLRTWTWTNGRPQELSDHNPIQRIRTVAAIATS